MSKINKKKYPKNCRGIVCLGGGNAMPKAVLAGLKNVPNINLGVICAMLDSGGSSGREREIYKTNVAFGDIRRAFLALSEASPEVKKAFSIRFKEGPYKGIVIANILGTAVAQQTTDYKNYETALRIYEEILKVPAKYQILPATLDDAHLCAVLENGQRILGEKNIDKPKHSKKLKIKRVFLQPKAKAYKKSLLAIKKADLIVIGPGDLYSTLTQVLLPEGMREAFKKSRAKKVYVCNLMTKSGETNNFSVFDFASEIEKYAGVPLDYVIYNTKTPSKKLLSECKKWRPELVDLVKLERGLERSTKFVGADLLASEGGVVHDPKKIAKIIMSLV